MEIPTWDTMQAVIEAVLFLAAIFIATAFRLYDWPSESFKDVTLRRFFTVFIGALIAGFIAWFVVLSLGDLMDGANWVAVLSMAVTGMVAVGSIVGVVKTATT